jgi:hypothetical protein
MGEATMSPQNKPGDPTIQGLQRQVLELQIEQLKNDIHDHETRLRIVEDGFIRFNFILYLTMGGGFVSLITLAVTVINIVKGQYAP